MLNRNTETCRNTETTHNAILGRNQKLTLVFFALELDIWRFQEASRKFSRGHLSSLCA